MKVEKYAETEILKGRKHQDVFNEIAASSDFKIHDIAEILRKIASPEKRVRYKSTNYVLAGVILCMALLNIYSQIEGKANNGVYNWLPVIGDVILLWGILNYWKNIYRVCLILLWTHTVVVISLLIFNFNWIFVFLLFFLIDSIIITFYLNIKTATDYRLNRELLNENPGQRINAVIFNEN
ncbi:MAG TPA: hypothetical protein VNZ49_07620 [Bacteroidia bacterium]|jgi:hypothetical protein|nr:hypothetical protein [Bacteroidia bacterium]